MGLRTLADLIDLHIADMLEVRKPLRRSKANTLELLRQQLGTTRDRTSDSVTGQFAGSRKSCLS